MGRLFALLVFPLTLIGACQAVEENSPNFVFLIADDWSFPHASVLGDSTVKTPTFDRIARAGVLFEYAFVSAPSCSPARSAILAGQHHWRLEGAANLGGSLRAETPLVTDLLAERGYLIGKWGKGVWPSKHVYRKTKPLPEGHERFEKFLERREGKQPFFYWYGGQDPHRPYDRGSGREAGIDPAKIELPPGLPDSEIVREDVADYYAEVQRFDRECGRILKQLEEAGELENTVVVMCSDNGMPFPRCKATLYDMGTRVPLAIMWQGKFKAGRRVSDFVSLQDLAPTWLEMAGAKAPASMNARSLEKILRSNENGKIEAGRDFVVTGMERHVECNPQRALRTERFLLIKNYFEGDWPVAAKSDYNHNIDPSPTKSHMLAERDAPGMRELFAKAFTARPEIELYDLKKDPAQLNNVAGRPGYAEAKKQMLGRLVVELAKTADPRRDRKGEFFEVYRKREAAADR